MHLALMVPTLSVQQETLSKKADTELLLREYEELSKLYAPVEDEVRHV